MKAEGAGGEAELARIERPFASVEVGDTPGRVLETRFRGVFSGTRGLEEHAGTMVDSNE